MLKSKALGENSLSINKKVDNLAYVRFVMNDNNLFDDSFDRMLSFHVPASQNIRLTLKAQGGGCLPLQPPVWFLADNVCSKATLPAEILPLFLKLNEELGQC